MNKYYQFVLKHTIANTCLTVAVFALFTASAFVTVAYAGDASALGFSFTSVEGFMGFGLGASAGYAFSQKTTVLALRERIEDLKEKARELDRLKSDALKKSMESKDD